MSINLKNATNNRRSFRLAPLELLVVALIVLGVLYLLTMWFSGAGHSAPQAASPVSAPAKQLEQTLMAYEKVEARLADLEARISDVSAKLEDLTKVEPVKTKDGKPIEMGKAEKLLSIRMSNMEKKLNTMAKHQATASDLAKIDKKLKGLQDHQAKAFKPLENKLVKLEKSQTETIKAIDGKIDKKVASLERKVKAAEAPHMVNAPVPDQEHMARLEKLEKSFSSKMDGDSALNKRISKITDELASLSQKIENLNKKTTKDSELKAEETPEKARESVKETEKTVEKEKKVQADTEPKEKLTSKLEGPPPETQVDKSHKVIHKVRRGQTLFRLARKYKVSVNQIKEWNPKLHGRRYLWVGEKLVMYPGQ